MLGDVPANVTGANVLDANLPEYRKDRLCMAQIASSCVRSQCAERLRCEVGLHEPRDSLRILAASALEPRPFLQCLSEIATEVRPLTGLDVPIGKAPLEQARWKVEILSPAASHEGLGS